MTKPHPPRRSAPSSRRASIWTRNNLEATHDGNTWSKPIAKGNGERAVVDIILPPTKARFVRIVQHGRAGGKFWSIHQLEVYAK